MSTTRWGIVQAGDSLRIIALRELGDALRWIELADLNELRPPYIIESVDPADRLAATLIWGDRILLPKGAAATTIPMYEDVYGTDVALFQRRLIPTSAGDWDVLSAGDNLGAALARRVNTVTGELLAHPSYGCDVANILGFKLRPISILLGAGYVKQAILADPRVDSLIKLETSAEGDTAGFGVEVQPINGETPVTLNLVFPWE